MWLLWTLGCATPEPAENTIESMVLVGVPQLATLSVDGKEVHVEIANTRPLRKKGLMFREKLGDNEGMLFVYVDEKARSFWMKDTPLPLSAAYINSEGKIVNIVDMPPYSTDSYPSLYPAQYVLEMKQGWFSEHGVERGDFVTDLPKVTAEP